MLSSRILSWGRAPDKSKPDPPAAPIASRSTTSCCALKRNSAKLRSSPDERPSINNARQKETATVDHSRWLGLFTGHGRQRDRRRSKTNVRFAAARLSKHTGSYLRPLRRIARWTNGQQRSGPLEHRRGPGDLHGRHANRSDDFLRRVLQ